MLDDLELAHRRKQILCHAITQEIHGDLSHDPLNALLNVLIWPYLSVMIDVRPCRFFRCLYRCLCGGCWCCLLGRLAHRQYNHRYHIMKALIVVQIWVRSKSIANDPTKLFLPDSTISYRRIVPGMEAALYIESHLRLVSVRHDRWRVILVFRVYGVRQRRLPHCIPCLWPMYMRGIPAARLTRFGSHMVPSNMVRSHSDRSVRWMRRKNKDQHARPGHMSREAGDNRGLHLCCHAKDK